MENQNQKLIDSLRAAADFLEQHPELPKAHQNDVCGLQIGVHLYGAESKGRAASIVRTLGGKWDKCFHDTFATIDRLISPLVKLQVFVQRDAICRRIVKTKLVAAQPEQIVPAQPEREETEIEWVCDEPLLAH